MTTTLDVADEVNKKIDTLYKKYGLPSKEGFVDAILRLSLWDDAKVEQAVMIVKAYGLKGSTSIENMGH